MRVYYPMTLGNLIERLNELPPSDIVFGLGTEVHSYRGFYERNGIAPSNKDIPVRHLAQALVLEIGKPMEGWKGGEYFISSSELVYITTEGSTGPPLIGLDQNMISGIWEPVLLADSWIL